MRDALETLVATTAERLSPRALIVLAAVAVGTAYACGDKTAATAPEQPTEQASIAFTGPDSVRLSCDLEGAAHYVLSEKTGPIANLVWRLDGTVISTSSEADAELSSLGTHSIQLDGYTNDDQRIASASKTIDAQLPADLSSCAPASRISGRFAVLIPTNAESSSSVYAAHVPPALEDHVDSFHWTLQQGSGDPQEVATGSDASSVTVAFSQAGTYMLRLEELVGSTTTPFELQIKVRRGDAVLEAGQIAIWRRLGNYDSPNAIYLLDGETGILSDALVQGPQLGTDVSCTGELLAFIRSELDSTLEYKSHVFTIGLDGSAVQRRIDKDGSQTEPSIQDHTIAVMDDARGSPELATYDLDTKNFTYLAGPTPSSAYQGSSPTLRLSPYMDMIALGSVKRTVNGKIEYHIVEYMLSGASLGPLHEEPLSELYGDSIPIEGGTGIAYDPRNEYVAYDLGLFSGKHMIVLSDNAGAITYLTEGMGPVFFSPSGDHILYQQVNYDEQSTELMMMGRDGTNPVNVTRDVLGIEGMVTDVGGGYCYDRPH